MARGPGGSLAREAEGGSETEAEGRVESGCLGSLALGAKVTEASSSVGHRDVVCHHFSFLPALPMGHLPCGLSSCGLQKFSVSPVLFKGPSCNSLGGSWPPGGGVSRAFSILRMSTREKLDRGQ